MYGYVVITYSRMEALPPPEPSLGKWVGEGLYGGCTASTLHNRPFGCLVVEVGVGSKSWFIRYTSPAEHVITIWRLW